jgi:hypothetical protein
MYPAIGVIVVLMVAVFIFRRGRVKQTRAGMSKTFSRRRWNFRSSAASLAAVSPTTPTAKSLYRHV